MKKNSITFCLIAAVCCLLAVASGRADEMRTIEGQVFIRTKGGDNIKLSLVDVLLFDEKVIEAHLENKREAAAPIDAYLQSLKQQFEEVEKRAEEAYKRADEAVENGGKTPDDANASAAALTEAKLRRIDVEEKAYYPRSPDFYFSDLPSPRAVTKTDADGKFTFAVPEGSYVLAAISSREAAEETEKYHWMVKVKADADKKVMLANDNLSSSGSPDSLIATAEYTPWEYPIYPAKIRLLIEQAGIAQKRDASYNKELDRLKAEERYLKAQEATTPRQSLDVLASFVFRKNPQAAQRKAIDLYPDLGVAGSPLNKEFVARVKRCQLKKKEFFNEPDWPIRLGKECNEDLAGKKPTK